MPLFSMRSSKNIKSKYVDDFKRSSISTASPPPASPPPAFPPPLRLVQPSSLEEDSCNHSLANQLQARQQRVGSQNTPSAGEKSMGWHKAVMLVDGVGKFQHSMDDGDRAKADKMRGLLGLDEEDVVRERAIHDSPHRRKSVVARTEALNEISFRSTELAPVDMRCLALISHNHMKPAMHNFVIAHAGKHASAH